MEEPTQPIRKSFVIITVCLVVLIAGACIAYYSGHRNPPGPGPTPAAIASEGSNSVAELSSQKHALPPVAVAPDPVEAKPLTVTAPAPVEGNPLTCTAPAPVVSPEARELVSRLAQLNITNGPLTQEKLSAWQAT